METEELMKMLEMMGKEGNPVAMETARWAHFVIRQFTGDDVELLKRFDGYQRRIRSLEGDLRVADIRVASANKALKARIAPE